MRRPLPPHRVLSPRAVRRFACASLRDRCPAAHGARHALLPPQRAQARSRPTRRRRRARAGPNRDGRHRTKRSCARAPEGAPRAMRTRPRRERALALPRTTRAREPGAKGREPPKGARAEPPVASEDGAGLPRLTAGPRFASDARAHPGATSEKTQAGPGPQSGVRGRWSEAPIGIHWQTSGPARQSPMLARPEVPHLHRARCRPADAEAKTNVGPSRYLPRAGEAKAARLKRSCLPIEPSLCEVVRRLTDRAPGLLCVERSSLPERSGRAKVRPR